MYASALWSLSLICMLRFQKLSNFEQVLDRTMQLVKPGGWLILDELMFRGDGGQNAFWKQFQRYMMGHHSAPHAGEALQGIIESSGLFSDVNVRKVILPVSKCDDPQLGELGCYSPGGPARLMCF